VAHVLACYRPIFGILATGEERARRGRAGHLAANTTYRQDAPPEPDPNTCRGCSTESP
jgi:hypothetical protein